jgi:hypothetical protein
MFGASSMGRGHVKQAPVANTTRRTRVPPALWPSWRMGNRVAVPRGRRGPRGGAHKQQVKQEESDVFVSRLGETSSDSLATATHPAAVAATTSPAAGMPSGGPPRPQSAGEAQSDSRGGRGAEAAMVASAEARSAAAAMMVLPPSASVRAHLALGRSASSPPGSVPSPSTSAHSQHMAALQRRHLLHAQHSSGHPSHFAHQHTSSGSGSGSSSPSQLPFHSPQAGSPGAGGSPVPASPVPAQAGRAAPNTEALTREHFEIYMVPLVRAVFEARDRGTSQHALHLIPQDLPPVSSCVGVPFARTVCWSWLHLKCEGNNLSVLCLCPINHLACLPPPCRGARLWPKPMGGGGRR